MFKIVSAAVAAFVAIVCWMPVCCTAQISNQDNEIYKASSAKLREQAWGMDQAVFKDYKVPEKYKDCSKVKLAEATSVSVGDAAAVKNAMTRYLFLERRLIKLNDAAAVAEYSEQSFTQMKKSRSSYYGYKRSDFYGARVIKKDGTVVDVNVDDAVLTKDETRERDAKIAIPDLQQGDILDYYFATEFNFDPKLFKSMPLYFSFFDNAPRLHYHLHCSIGPKLAAEYRCYNSAPDFNSSKDADGNTILDVRSDTTMFIPDGTRWVSPLRQAPFIQLNVMMGDAVPYTPFTRRRPGELIKDQDPEKILRDAMIDLNSLKTLVLREGAWRMRKKSDVVDAYFEALIKGGRRLQEDSAAAELYYMFRFDYMFGALFSPNAKAITELAHEDVSTMTFHYMLSEYFKSHGMASEVVLLSPNDGVPMNTVMNKYGLRTMCNVHGTHDMLFGVSDLYAPAFSLPADLEGVPDALAVDTKGDHNSYMASAYTWRRIAIPASTAADNVHSETLSILPDLENNNLRVRRTTSLTGHQKEDIQRKLLLIEDFYNSERDYFNDQRSLDERIADHREPKAAEEMRAAFAAAREKQKDAFLNDSKALLGKDITEQTNIRIINPGVRHQAPAFEYSSTFRLSGLMKKAGNNYVLEVGGLIGPYSHLQGGQRNRILDVYGNYPKTFKEEINVAVPEGYTPEGMAELAKSIKTSAGGFTSSAEVKGNILNISLEWTLSSRYYANKDWPQVLAILDAAADWTTSKVLLKKMN